MAGPSSSRVMLRGLELLEYLADARNGCGAKDVAEFLGVHRSSVYRYLSLLVERGYVERTDESSYRIGPKILELANLVLDRMDLREIARPFLIELCQQTDTTVHLCRLDGADVVYLDKVETDRSLPLVSRVGGRAPAYCTGVGKALLSHISPERRHFILRDVKMEAFTPTTHVTMASLEQDLGGIRECGYAEDRCEHEEGISCVAVPIFDFYGEVVASISATDLSRRLDEKKEVLVLTLQEAAGAISARLGADCKEACS